MKNEEKWTCHKCLGGKRKEGGFSAEHIVSCNNCDDRHFSMDGKFHKELKDMFIELCKKDEDFAREIRSEVEKWNSIQ